MATRRTRHPVTTDYAPTPMRPMDRVHCDHSAPARYVDTAVDVVRQAVEPRYYEPAPPRYESAWRDPDGGPSAPTLAAILLAMVLLFAGIGWAVGVYEDRQFAECAARAALPDIPAGVTDACYWDAFKTAHGKNAMPQR